MRPARQTGSDALADLARFCEGRLKAHGLSILARVRESDRAFDIAVGLPTGDVGSVVRCVERAEPSDYGALQTMLAEGDFNRAALVYAAEDQPHLSDSIRCYPISCVDQLAASLARETTS